MRAATAAPRGANDPGLHALTGTAVLVRFMLRRDRIRLPAWALGLGLFVIYLISALPALALTEEELATTAQLFADPVGRLMIGPGYGFDAPTYARFVANGYGLYFLLFSAIMSLLLVVRHTRVEEQTGRAELVRANVIGRSAPLVATLVVALVTNVAVAAVVFATMVGPGGFAAGGSATFAASIAATGLAFAGLTTITAQLTEYSRAAAGMAGAALGAAFVIRAGGDMAAEGGTTLSWFSPLGWGQQTAPFVLDRWWPLALSLAFAAATSGVGYALAVRRDLGASFVATRPGRPGAAPALGRPFGLALRLQRASIIGWSAALAVGGLAFGAYADALLAALEDLPEVFVELFGAEDMLAGYLSYMAVYMAFVAGVYVVLAVHGLRSEELRGRAEPVLATPVSRWTWMGSHLTVTAAGTVLVMAAAGLGTGIGAAMVTGDASHIWELFLAHLNHVPAVWSVLGAAALLFGVAPRLLGAAWVLPVYGLVIGTFGMLLDLPPVAFDLSPFSHAAELPLEPFDAVPLLLLTAAALVTTGLGLAAFRRRQVNVS